MKTTILTFFMMALPMGSVFGVPPPSVYKKAMHDSSEQLLVRMERVVNYHLRHNTHYVRARAKILRVEHANHRVRVGSWITIRYRYNMRKWVTMPRLREGQVYRAYLNRSSRRWFYEPAAGSHSFVPINSRRKHHERARHSLRF
jgi:hypothetical protein